MRNFKESTLIYLAVFAISCSVLIFEIISLKFLSLKLLGSWGFLVISTAFLGIGASGTYLYLRKDKKLLDIDFAFLSKFSTLYTISIALSVIIFALIPLSIPQAGVEIYAGGVSSEVIWGSLLYMLIFALPFFLSGVCIGYILSLKTISVGRALFFDLSGAGFGSFLAVIFLSKLGGYGILALSMFFAYIASVIFLKEAYRRNRMVLIGLHFFFFIFFLSGLLIYPSVMIKINKFDIAAPKTQEGEFRAFQEDFNGLAATYWNPITRIDLSKEAESGAPAFFPGLSKKYSDKKYPGRYILLDAGAPTRQFNLGNQYKDIEFLGHFLLSIPYRLKNEEMIDDVLIIGAGGGTEILIAKHFKAKNIDVAEINSAVADILKGENKNDPLSGIYSAFTSSDSETTVNVYNEEGRSFLSRNKKEKYDIVELNGVDLLSSLKGGGLIFSDNYLYTQEALGYYFDALKDGGYAQIGYWGQQYSLRLFNTALSMLESRGQPEPHRSLAVVAGGNWVDIIIKKGFFSNAEIKKIKEVATEDGFEVLFAPDLREDFLEQIRQVNQGIIRSLNIEYRIDGKESYILASLDEKRESLTESRLKNFPFDLTPTHDDKPFFYAIYKYDNVKDPSYKLAETYAEASQQRTGQKIIVIGTILAFLLILFPLCFSGRLRRTPTYFQFMVFFGVAGAAFSLLEVVLIQKFSIFVGGPFYSMSVTLPTMLIFYGLGALFTSKIKTFRFALLMVGIGGIVFYGFLGYLFLDNVIESLFHLNHFSRIIFTVILVSPLGFLLGFPTPIVLETIKEKIDRTSIPLLWGINSSGNVIGALVFGAVSQSTGFNMLLLISSLLFPVALIFLLSKIHLLKV